MFEVRSLGIFFALVLGTGCRANFELHGSVDGGDDLGDDGGSSDVDASPPRCDAATCGDGFGCTVDSECTSGQCECSNAACTAKVCSTVACACQFNSDGESTCDGNLGEGVGDADGTCPGGCDGSGNCLEPFLWYKFDEPAGASAFANSGTWPGNYSSFTGTLGVAGKRGNAIRLTATNAVTIADDDSFDNLAGWTVAGWINMSTLPRNAVSPLLTKASTYGCFLGERSQGCTDCYTGNMFVVFANGSGGGGWDIAPTPPTDAWFHLACTWGPGGGMTTHWNGSPLDTFNSASYPTLNTTSSITVGTNVTGDSFDGLVDELKLWRSELSARAICLDACGSFAGDVCTFDGICGN